MYFLVEKLPKMAINDGLREKGCGGYQDFDKGTSFLEVRERQITKLAQLMAVKGKLMGSPWAHMGVGERRWAALKWGEPAHAHERTESCDAPISFVLETLKKRISAKSQTESK